MSIEKEIPRDISRYEAKAVGPFTARQLLYGVPAFGLALGAYFLTKQYIADDGAFFVAFIVAMPLLLLGFAKPYGMHLEKFLSIVFVSLILAPKHRKYITENTYKDLSASEKTSTSNCKKNKKNKSAHMGEHKQYL